MFLRGNSVSGGEEPWLCSNTQPRFLENDSMAAFTPAHQFFSESRIFPL